MSTSARKFATRCIHAGYRATPASPAVVAPLVQSTTFLLDDASYRHMLEGRAEEALIYTRLGNPTLDVVQERLASLEGTEHALVFASGMAAIHAALMSSLPRGGSIVAHRELYGSSWDLMANQLAPYGIRTELVDLDDPQARAAGLCAAPAAGRLLRERLQPHAARGRPRRDRQGRARRGREAARRRDLRLARAAAAGRAGRRSRDPFGHEVPGRALGSHGWRRRRLARGLKPIYRWLQLAGGCLDPHSAALLERGLKTLPLRMRAHCANACGLALHLAGHPRVTQVLHPSLPAHRSHATARKLLPDFGGMLSFVVQGGDAAALRFVRALELALEASSLGGVETLVSLPYNTSHARFTPDQRAAALIPAGFVRVSVGVEDLADLVADFDQALARV